MLASKKTKLFLTPPIANTLLILSLILPCSLSFANSNQPVFQITETQLTQAITERFTQVDEFQFLADWGRENHCRVFGAGGTAAALAHYIRMDLERDWLKQNSLPQKYFESLFGYDYLDIYRSTQDADIVVDCPGDGSLHEQLAQKLEKEVQEKFPHNQGSKSAWEVRFLKYVRFQGQGPRQKDALIGSDFQNQHTDSHSTGLIEFTTPAPGEGRVRDVMDWNNQINPLFLRDILQKKLHYYFNPKHETTFRFSQGLNPPILSVIRYFTKAFQYGLDIREEDRPQLLAVIQSFKREYAKSDLNPYVFGQINSNALKLFWHAQDVEFAANTLDAFGLRDVLKTIGSGHSMGVWLGKEPLRTRPIGTGNGKTARELGITEISHDTTSPLAHENIVRSPNGMLNAFISRQGYPDEQAIFGNGFYYQVGKKGTIDGVYTIRSLLHPDARQSLDGGITGDFIFVPQEVVRQVRGRGAGVYASVIVINKAAATVQDSSLTGTPEDYFKMRSEVGSEPAFNPTNFIPAYLNKLERKIVAKLNRSNSDALEEIANIVRKNIQSDAQKNIGYFTYDFNSPYADVFQYTAHGMEKPSTIVETWLFKLHKSADPKYSDIVQTLLDQKKCSNDMNLIHSVFSSPFWFNHPKMETWIETLIPRENSMKPSEYCPSRVLSLAELLTKPQWASHPKLGKWFGMLLQEDQTSGNPVLNIVKRLDWTNHLEIIEVMLKLGNFRLVVDSAMSNRKWSDYHPKWIEMFLALDDKQFEMNRIANGLISVLTQEHLVKHPSWALWIQNLIDRGKSDLTLLTKILPLPASLHHPEWIDYYLKKGDTGNYLYLVESSSPTEVLLLEHVLSQPHWAKHPPAQIWFETIRNRADHLNQKARNLWGKDKDYWSIWPKIDALLQQNPQWETAPIEQDTCSQHLLAN